MKKIDKFVNQYGITKTLKFSLIPQGKTEENFNRFYLQEDERRASDYSVVKQLMDNYHKKFIEKSLGNFEFFCLKDYTDLYLKKSKDSKDNDSIKALEEKMRKQIANALKNADGYTGLFKKEMIEEYLPKEEEVLNFTKFTTYFSGFFENRKNMYSDEEKSTAISYRVVNQNLPKFLDNAKQKENILSNLPLESITDLNYNATGLWGCKVEDIFEIDYFNFVITQSGIEKYNQIIGGYTTKDGKKIKGLNEYINEYNQRAVKKLPKLKMLFKQILSDRETISFIPEHFEADSDVLNSIRDFYKLKNQEKRSIEDAILKINELLLNFEKYNLNGIFIKNGVEVTDISNSVFKSYSVISQGLNKEYDAENGKNKNVYDDKYQDKRKAYFKKIDSFSVAHLQNAATSVLENAETPLISDYVKDKSLLLSEDIKKSYLEVKPILMCEGTLNKKLCTDDEKIALIKTFLDSIKNLQRFLKLFLGSGKEYDKDALFYGEFDSLYNQIDTITTLYDKTRNYLTQKPYSLDKIKLNFGNPQLLGGWDVNKERDYLSVILKDDNSYYLAIMDKSANKSFLDINELDAKEPFYQKMNYKMLPGPNKMLPKVFFSNKSISYYNPSDKLLKNYKNNTHIKGDNFNLKDCHELIDFFKA